MRKSTIISTLKGLYAQSGDKIPGWTAVSNAGIQRKDIYKHWEWLTEAFKEAIGPSARKNRDDFIVLRKEEEEEREDEREEDAPVGHHHFSVYVVNLQSAIGKLQWFADKNPNGKKACLYVGATWHTPEERLANHKRGHKSARRVRPYMIKIDKDLTEEHRRQYATRDEAERVEKRLAITLRKQGYRVWQR